VEISELLEAAVGAPATAPAAGTGDA
jgi:hypothetical protein